MRRKNSIRAPIAGDREYGPETPGYAHLNEIRRREQAAIKPTSKSRAKKEQSHSDEPQPK